MVQNHRVHEIETIAFDRKVWKKLSGKIPHRIVIINYVNIIFVKARIDLILLELSKN